MEGSVMRKLFLKIHLWLSVPFGLVITLLCFSGAMLVFEKEVTELMRRDMYFTPSSGRAPVLTLDGAAALVSGTLPDGVEVTGVTVHSDPDRTWQVSLSEPRKAYVCVDQYTGEIRGRSERPAFFSVMFRLHRWLLDSMRPGETVFWGKMVTGTSTLMFVLVLVSGVVIWWPRTLKALKGRLRLSTGKGWGRFWHDLHVAGGIYALLLLLSMALTGLTWSFQWYRTGFYKVFGAEASSGRPGHAAPREASGSADTMDIGIWQQVYESLADGNPDYARISVADGTASVSFDRLGNRRASDRYTFDRTDGDIPGVQLYADASRASKIRGWIYSVHVGSWGGIVTRIAAFLAALIGASLPLTGYWLWFRRLYLKNQTRRRTVRQ